MNAIPASYFDGKTTRAHPVMLAHDSEGWRIEGDGIQLRFPADQATLPPATGDATRHLRLPDGGRCEINDISSLAALEPVGSTKRSRVDGIVARLETRPRIVAACALALAAVFIATFYLSLPKLAERLASAVPATVEQRISKHTLQVFDNQIFGYSTIDANRQYELQTSFQSLLAATGYRGKPLKLKFRRMAGNMANAFALPDGTLILTDGLVEIAQDDDEIMAVLAHEIGHCEKHHAVRMLLQESAAFVFAVSLLGDTSAITNIAGALPLLLTSKKYSRDFEREADLYALEAMERAEMPLHRFVDIMERMEKANQHGQTNRYISTHPPTAERLKAFRDSARKPRGQ